MFFFSVSLKMVHAGAVASVETVYTVRLPGPTMVELRIVVLKLVKVYVAVLVLVAEDESDGSAP